MSSEESGQARLDTPADRPVYARVALPLALREPLTYSVPLTLAPLAKPGTRVRVPLGQRKTSGFLVELTDARPEGVKVRPLIEIRDREPLLSEELLELAAWVADYYLASLGEVLQAMVPAGLESWGDRRVQLTDAGALAPLRDPDAVEMVAALRESGPIRLGELQAETGSASLQELIERLERRGLVRVTRAAERSRGYERAVEPARGDPEDLMGACGRSRPGRQVVELLLALGRPATEAELQEAVGCGPGVIRRLVKKGVLRQFEQARRLDLGRHRLEGEASGPHRLRPDQAEAVAALRQGLERGEFSACLLEGMTGSGKTEVYLQALRTCLEQGRTAILLVPEIALVPALARQVGARFGDQLALLHSGLTPKERQQEWERIRKGAARVVLGPRSAVFAPVRDLGLLVVDEEQDPAYKQDSNPRYHGRDVALLRGSRAGAVVLLVSATASLEARRNAETGKLRRLELTRRVGVGSLPEGVLVDLRQDRSVRRPGEIRFSATLLEELERALGAGDQVILLRNRRGYAPLLLCRACGEDMRCEDCGLPRTLHKRESSLICHYCGSRRPVPEVCPACGEKALEALGAGTERVEEQFAELFPGVPVAALDRDVVRRPGGAAAVLEGFDRGETQVLVGTQMVSKGHHFPRVALTAVLLADTYLGFPDFRAVERTYALLTQVAGRAGRGDRPGKVVIQTYHPGHYAIQAALNHQDELFAEEELRFRRIFHYPPYTRMVQLLVRDSSRARGQERVNELAAALERSPLAAGVRVRGPAPAPFERLRGSWRFQILLRGVSGGRLRQLVESVLPEQWGAELVVDVDPQELM